MRNCTLPLANTPILLLFLYIFLLVVSIILSIYWYTSLDLECKYVSDLERIRFFIILLENIRAKNIRAK